MLVRSSIKLGQRIDALYRDRLCTDAKITSLKFNMSSYFNLKYPLPALFCPSVVYQYTCFRDKKTSHVSMTTRQLFERIENHLSTIYTSSNSVIKFHRNRC